jgi:hypothetical protein
MITTKKEVTLTNDELILGLLAVANFMNSELYDDEFVAETASEPEEVQNNIDNLVSIFKGGIVNAD